MHSAVFKAKVVLAERFEVHPHRITALKRRLGERAIDVFVGGGTAAAPPLDLKELHATIGRLTLESDFSECALHKAGLLSAKR